VPTATAAPAHLLLSDEVAWYLTSRGIPFPECPPAVKTPEPGELLADAVFDGTRVDRVLAAFHLLRHTQGRFAGKPLDPDPWQVAYVIAPVFGWVHRNDAGRYVRIIREAYVELPRKNGKSTTCGGIGLYLTCCDGEQGAQVVAAATTTKQASYVFGPVRTMVKSAPALKGNVVALSRKIIHAASGSAFEVVSSVAEAMHGANIHGAIIDELHVHKSPDLVETIETGTGSREQPLVVIITTADDGQQATIYARKRNRIESLAARTVTHASVYGVIWCADEADDPFVEPTWRKANPGFGISPTREYLIAEAGKAKDDPAELAKFLRLHLGVRTKLDKRYIPLDKWDANAGMVDETTLVGRECYGGLDLASTSDLCALAWDFPTDDGSHQVIWRLWCPERAYDALVKRTHGEARVWRKAGRLTVTPGDVADYDYIRLQLNRDRAAFAVKAIAYDRWNSSQLVNDLTEKDNAPMVGMGQGMVSMNPPLKQLLHLVLEGTADAPRYRHGGHPVLRWMVDNLRVATDAAGNVKPDKGRSMDKIDGFSAAVMALGLAMQRTPARRSAYEDQGLEVV
jgi:phage terminase large subunit-like protein